MFINFVNVKFINKHKTNKENKSTIKTFFKYKYNIIVIN